MGEVKNMEGKYGTTLVTNAIFGAVVSFCWMYLQKKKTKKKGGPAMMTPIWGH